VENAPETVPAPESETKSYHPDTTKWLANVAQDTAAETGMAAVFGAVGRLVAGEKGRTLGKQAGIVLAKHLNWSLPSTRKRKDPAKTQAAPEETASSPEG